MSERTWTVAEIGARIDQVVGQRMANRFWVRGEVADLSRTQRGTVLLTLVQTDDHGRVLARLPVTISPGTARLVDRRMSRAGQPLSGGIEVRLRGNLSWFTPSGRLSLAVADVDPAHTVGAMAVARRALLAALHAEGLADANAARPLARLPLRLGLVTRAGSQAYHDLLDELAASRLPFRVTVVSAGVQGVAAPAELQAAVRTVGGRDDIDLVLLTRGGGAAVELATFDHPDVARAVASCPVPVWTGIGHHLDTPVAEQVAARALKTPTALGQAVVGVVRDAIDGTESCWRAITTASTRHVAQTTVRLDGATDRLRRGAASVITRAERRLDTWDGLTRAYDPKRLLARGWSVTHTAGGDLVVGPMPAGTLLRTTTGGGTLMSEVVDEDR